MANTKRQDGNDGKLVFVKDNIYKIPYRRKGGEPANKYFVKTVCCICGTEVFADKSNYSKHRRCVCGRKCQNAIIEKPDGFKKNKRGASIVGGHILIKDVNNPNSKKGWVPEHRWIMEKSLGRFLSKTEIVHHIDMDKTNNTITNLCIFDNAADHFKSHGSLNICVKELFEKGVICFDMKTKTYQHI